MTYLDGSFDRGLGGAIIPTHGYMSKWALSRGWIRFYQFITTKLGKRQIVSVVSQVFRTKHTYIGSSPLS